MHQNLCKSFEELSWNHRTLTPHWFWDKRRCGTSFSTCKRRNISRAVPIWLGWKKVGWFYGMLLPSAKMSKTSWQTGKILMKKDLGDHSKGPIIPFGSLVEYLPSSARDQASIHQFGKNVLPRIFPGYALIAGWIWKGDILVADTEELKILDATEIYPSRLNAKEVLIW